MPSGHSHFAESVEEYLEAIYRLEREGPGVTTSGLASELGVSPASVSGFLKKLAGEGFLEHEPRGTATLTQKGAEVGARTLRRHRLAERLLTDVLGMAWDEVHEEACRLEHAISGRVERRLMEFLGNPKTCPHGHPIPAEDGSEATLDVAPLAQAEPGDGVRIAGVTDEVPEMLRYLREIGLLPGVSVHVVEKAPLGGPVTIAVDGRQHAISLELARTILVEVPPCA
ncbi:MAG TPA: metal-dependent transcriptional regulator [Candidatus Dormibacteraeota bacterium]|nr:metal-dependent transcriptional regulator [Candidatus Dormibacteraeota bacterium]